MAKSLAKRGKAKDPEREWLGLRKVSYVISVRKDQSSCGVGKERDVRRWVLHIIQIKNLSYFEILFGCWTMFPLSVIVLEKSCCNPDLIPQSN